MLTGEEETAADGRVMPQSLYQVFVRWNFGRAPARNPIAVASNFEAGEVIDAAELDVNECRASGAMGSERILPVDSSGPSTTPSTDAAS